MLTRLRQESVEWAKARGTHYFVVDYDNFIVPDTLETHLETRLSVIGPLLRLSDKTYYTIIPTITTLLMKMVNTNIQTYILGY